MNLTTTTSLDIDPNLDPQKAPQNHHNTMEISSAKTYPNSDTTDSTDEEIQSDQENTIWPSQTSPQGTVRSFSTSAASADHDPNPNNLVGTFQLPTYPTGIQMAMSYPQFYQEGLWDCYLSSSPTEESSSTTEEPTQPLDIKVPESIHEDAQFATCRSQEHGPYVIAGVDIEKACLMWDLIKDYVEEATAAAIAAEEERKAMEIKMAEMARIAAERRRVMEEQKAKKAEAVERKRELREKAREKVKEKKRREIEVMRVQMELEAKIARKKAERDALIATAAREYAERKRNSQSKF